MRIGLDLRTAAGDNGIAQYGRSLATALALIDAEDEFTVFRKTGGALPFWTAHVAARFRFRRARLDVLHVTGGAAPLGYRRPYVLTVHDLAIYRHPEWFPDGQWFSTRVAFPSAVKLARKIIVPSVSTKEDLAALMGMDGGRIAVIPHGVSPMKSAGRQRQPISRYVLCLGTIEPRKNILTLVRAYRLMIDRHPELKEVKLLIVGAVGWKAEAIIDEIRKTQCEGYRISLAGPVSEETKWDLLANAACFAYPSNYEGFGLPLLEAMAAGAPAVSADNSSLPEVAGEAARLIPAEDIEAWSREMRSVLTDKKTAAGLRSKGLARAASFSWEETARRTLEIYRAVSA